jgi:hypothetical protein
VKGCIVLEGTIAKFCQFPSLPTCVRSQFMIWPSSSAVELGETRGSSANLWRVTKTECTHCFHTPPTVPCVVRQKTTYRPELLHFTSGSNGASTTCPVSKYDQGNYLFMPTIQIRYEQQYADLSSKYLDASHNRSYTSSVFGKDAKHSQEKFSLLLKLPYGNSACKCELYARCGHYWFPTGSY